MLIAGKMLMNKKNMRATVECEESSGNIFEDLGFPDAQERLAKVDLAIKILAVIEQKKLSQAAAVKLLGIDKLRFVAFSRAQLEDFSIEWLFELLIILGHNIVITVSSARRSKKAGISVVTLR